MAKIKEYALDPKEVGVTLDVPGNPTSRGWEVVTPEAWRFRWSVADKAMAIAPDYFRDKDWYCDLTKVKAFMEIHEENLSLHPAELSVTVLERYLESQHIHIRPYELLLGNTCGDGHGILFDPTCELWMLAQQAYKLGRCMVWENGKKIPVSEDLFGRMERVAQAINPMGRLSSLLSESLFMMYYMCGVRYFEPAGYTGYRANPDHEWYIKIGFRGLIDLMGQTIERLERESLEVPTNRFREIRKRIVDCKASIRATEAVIKWIKRHAQVAGEMAAKATDPKDRERLEQTAGNCEWVAENPPRTFWEAQQLHWLSFAVHYIIEASSHNGTAFRPDQVFWGWYERDVIKEKTLSRLKAGEIVANYGAKMHETGGVFISLMEGMGGLEFTGAVGLRDAAVTTLGGQTGDGKDATNDLTMLFLDVYDGYRLHYPDIKLRWHKKFDRNNLRRAVEIMRTGLGSPSLRNDEVTIPGLLDQYGDETSLEEARSWAIVGCNTPGITINSRGSARREAFHINMLKALEFALFNGRDTEPGFEWVKSIETGDPTCFKDFEEFYEGWLKQWDWLMKTEMKVRNTIYEELGETLRRPFLSMLYRRCVDEGVDIMALDIPRLSFYGVAGFVDTVDSLAAVKYLVYDKKKYSMAQLLEALKVEWEGYEEMRREFKDAPKFGNNDDYVDELFAQAVNDIYRRGKSNLDVRGKPAFSNMLVLTWMYFYAPLIGALPNGRKRGEALCDGGINPHAEFDVSGPMDRMASALKIDQTKCRAWIYNQKFDYSMVEGDAGLNKLMDYSMAGLEEGMDQMQFNFISKETLEDAQEHPEGYPYLSVRVSGYSAFFTGLPRFVQEAVIERVEHKL